MGNCITLKILEEDSNLVERKYFEYEAGKDSIAFLMKDRDINKGILNEYIKTVETRFYELEKIKRLLSKKYEPRELLCKSYEYSFDFENESITYVEKNT